VSDQLLSVLRRTAGRATLYARTGQ